MDTPEPISHMSKVAVREPETPVVDTNAPAASSTTREEQANASRKICLSSGENNGKHRKMASRLRFSPKL